MIGNDKVMIGWNEYGDLVLKQLYQSDKIDGIEDFIKNVVINKQDKIKLKMDYFLTISNWLLKKFLIIIKE